MASVLKEEVSLHYSGKDFSYDWLVTWRLCCVVQSLPGAANDKSVNTHSTSAIIL